MNGCFRVGLAFTLATLVAVIAGGAGIAALIANRNIDRTPNNAIPESGWEIQRMDITYEIDRDAVIEVEEKIDVDFRSLQRHGIFRDLVTQIKCDPDQTSDEALFECPDGKRREYLIDEISVTDGDGDKLQTKIEQIGRVKRIRIGDPDEFVTGEQSYVIRYRLRGALDPFEDHSEFYWNATGLDWVVPIRAATATVILPRGTEVLATDCFQGRSGSTATCGNEAGEDQVTFTASRALQTFEGITILAMFPKDEFEVPTPYLDEPLGPDDFVSLSPVELGTAGGLSILAALGMISVWWRNGRDRRYTSIHYLTNDTTEHTRPLFTNDQVVVEYLPPEDLRPAQMGVILDESADNVDVSATIVDLAVRGYLTITEVPKEGWFGSKDWVLTQVPNTEPLKDYERTLLDALFKGGRSDVRISELKNTFASSLARVKETLVEDAMRMQWFKRKPNTAVGMWMAAGIALMVIGALAVVGLGFLFGHALIGVPIVVAGIFLVGVSPVMSRRTAVGSEAMRRVLGFRLYVETAETRQQEFNEDQNILNKFARYLPYAMVFGCVDKWAKAFEGLADEQAMTSGWYYGYAGAGAFSATAFSSNMQGFASSVGSTLSSTRGSSGGGGGGGGSSGGGGGGGGGGSW